MLQEYQQRVVDEKSALDEKIAKLKAFTDVKRDIPAREVARLGEQLYHMVNYSKILGERIDAF